MTGNKEMTSVKKDQENAQAGKFQFYTERSQKLTLREFAERYERLYFGSVFLAALLGYGLLLFFPLLVVIGFYGLLMSIGNPSPENNLLHMGIWLAVITVAATTSYHLFIVRINPRFGISLPERRSPELYELIESNTQGLMSVKIHDVQLVDQFDLKIVKVPVYGFPIWSKNVLCIGFDFMQTMPKDLFNYAVASKLMQYSKKRAAVNRWLAQLSDIWLMYPAALRNRDEIGDKFLAFFFEIYAKFYQWLAVYVLHKSDLVGDDCGLSVYGDHNILEAVEAQALAELFLQKSYWPNFIKEHLRKSEEDQKLPNPYSNMPYAIEKSFSEERLNKLLRELNRKPEMIDSRFPSLKKRIENLGHTRIQLLKPWRGTAAKHYFGNHYSTVINIMARYWLSRNAALYKPAGEVLEPSEPEYIEAKDNEVQQEERIQHTQQAADVTSEPAPAK